MRKVRSLRTLFLLFVSLFSVRAFAQTPGGAYSSPSAGISSVAAGNGVGPVINVNNPAYSGCSATALADYSTCFASVSAASNAASLTAGAITNQSAVSTGCATCTSLNVTVNGTLGDTAIVFIVGTVPGRTFTINDGGSGYSLVEPLLSNSGSILVMATAPGGIKQTFSSLTITDSGAAENINASVVTFRNVGSYRFVTTPANQSGTAHSLAQQIQDINNVWVTGFAWFNGATTSASANAGAILTTVTGSATQDGWAVVSNTAASRTTVTDSITLSSGSNGVGSGLELRTRTLVLPTVSVPAGHYNYSSGLLFTEPVTFSCQPGAVLEYMGAAHALDFGTIGGLPAPLNTYPYYLDGCEFTGGTNYTQGIYFNAGTIVAGVRHTTFRNFGNATGFMIGADSNNWDLEIGPQVRFHVDDNTARNIFHNNIAAVNSSSFIRIHDVEAFCIASATLSASGCAPANTGIGFWVEGFVSFITNNNLAFFNPNIRLGANSGNYNYRVEHNMIEVPQGVGVDAIQFVGVGAAPQDRAVIHDNSFVMHGTASVVGPMTASDIITGLRFNFNSVAIFSDATPVVRLNNLAGQANNQSSNNMCSTAIPSAAPHPCVIPHTTGSNINNFSFNVDDQHTAGLYATTTNCSAIGSAASPSVAACAAAASGSFSCATNAVNTCTVNTTAVTANSNIIVQQRSDTTTGTRLGVTCNTTLSTVRPDVTALVAGTSFSFGLTQPVTNPNCYTYWIVN